MSKTRDTGNIGNIVRVDASGNVSFVSGSTTLATINTSGQLSGSSPVLSSSYASNAETLDGLDSTVFTLTSSFNAQTASFTAFTASINAFSASQNSFTASILAQTASLNTFSASVLTYQTNLNLKTASFATTGSNNFTAVQHIADTTNPTGFDTTASLYTEGGLGIKKDSYFSSSLYIKGNLTVYGTQSVSYITSSQLNISTNLITVNTATPSVRFGGIAVQDSGSTSGLTGSLLWDSQNNSWLYNNPSGSGNYDSSLVIMGPRNSSALGSEVGLSCNYLVQGHGHHHTTSSMIFHDGSITCFPGTVCAPGHVSSEDVRIYRSAGTTTGYINFGSTGTNYFGFDGSKYVTNGAISSTNGLFSGCIGIGTATINRTVSMKGTNEAWIENITTSTSTQCWLIGQDGTRKGAEIYDLNTTSTRLFIAPTTGFVGINTTSPDYQLHVQKSTCAGIRIRTCLSGGCAPMLNFFHEGNDEFSLVGGVGLSFLSSGTTQKMYIGSNVNISTNTTISNKLSVSTSGVADIPFAVGDWCNRGGRLLTSNCSSWWSDGATPCSVITSNTTVTCRGLNIGLALHNDGQSQSSFAPTLAFSRRSWSGIYNSTMATITAQAMGCGNDTNWVSGDLVFAVTPTGGYMGENLRISANYSCFNSTVCAPTFAGSTVRGSSNLDLNGNSGYLTLRTGDVTRLFVGSTGGVSVGAVSDPGVNNLIVAGTICSASQVKGTNLNSTGPICGSGFRSGASSGNSGGYTSDGLWGSTATPNLIYTTSGMGLLLGYTDNGSGLYGAAYGFDVSYRDGLNNPIDYNAIIMRNNGQGTTPFRVTSYGNIYGNSKNFRIKHPIPSMNDTHYLIHTSIEGPQADLIYRGKVQLVNGKAEVNIDLASRMTDGTFEALCQDVQSYTTNESGWSLTKSYVVENILHIEAQDETSDDIISWLVIGERNDDGIKNSAITDEYGHVIVEELKPEEGL